ncbi:MAG: HAMP domain-containing protein [Planctomycetes bacterium]|nr:HAMP domain-containing protein [Planctomycetota bacterium]
MRSRILFKLFASYASLVVVSGVLIDLLVSRFAGRDQRAAIEEALDAQAVLLADSMRAALAQGGEPGLAPRIEALGAATGSRLTVIAADGRVLADSIDPPAAMENHATRPEVIEAAASGRGLDERTSATTGQPTLYVCVAVHSAAGARLGFVRAALPLPSVAARAARLRSAVLGGVASGTVVALLLAWFVARRLTRPIVELTEAASAIADGRAGPSLDHGGRDEVAELARAFERMATRLAERVDEQQRERDQLALVLDRVAEGVVAIDGEERLLLCNGAARAMLGVADQGAIGRPLVELVRAPELVEAVRLRDVAPGEAGAPRSREVHLLLGGRERVLLVRAAALPSGGAVAALLDVTELRRLETVRRDFVANVSHELKTPLAAMRGLVETLVDDPAMDAATRQRFLGKLGHHVTRLADLAVDLLHLARAESDGPVARVALDLAAAARQAVDRFAGPAQSKSITLAADLAPAAAFADPLAIEQILDNLVDNALKYTPAGGRVEVRTAMDAGHARLEVSDTGVGIEPAEQGRVFERFYRVDKARARDVPGTGLGLSIVKHLCEANGGTIALESWPGRGSTFRVELPRPPEGAATEE